MERTVFLLVLSNSEEGPLETAVFETLEEACQALEKEYNNLCPADGDLDIDYDEEIGELSWIDVDMGCKCWFSIQQACLKTKDK